MKFNRRVNRNEITGSGILSKDDIIDVCVDNRRCIVNRCPEQKGDQLWLYAKQGNVIFKSIKISELKTDQASLIH